MEIVYWGIAATFFYGWIRNKNAGLLHLLLGAAASALWPVTIAGFAIFIGYAYLTNKGEV